MTSSSAPRREPTAVTVTAGATDAVLLERVRRGDAAAFRALFDRHAPRVWRFLRDLLGDDASADEATQETFVRAHAALGGAAPERLLPWLLGVARNVSHEQRRARARLVPVAEPVTDEVLDDAVDPEAVLLGREADAMLAWALARLTEDRRTALLLRTDHGLGYEDIADVLGWSLPRVKNEIHRARLQLRRALLDYLSPKEPGHGERV